RPDLRERAKKVPCLVVLPLGRGIQSAPPEPFDERSKRELQTARFSAAETREADDLLDLVFGCAGESLPGRVLRLEGGERRLVGPLSCPSRQDDVDQLVDRILLVAKIR